MRYSHLGVQFALTIGIAAYAGFWGDGRLGTSPLFTFLGMFAGFGAGVYLLYREVYPPGGPGGRGDGGDPASRS